MLLQKKTQIFAKKSLDFSHVFHFLDMKISKYLKTHTKYLSLCCKRWKFAPKNSILIV